MTTLDDRPVYALKTTPAVLDRHEDAIERARALKPQLRERVAEAERLRRLPSENVADLHEKACTSHEPETLRAPRLGTEA